MFEEAFSAGFSGDRASHRALSLPAAIALHLAAFAAVIGASMWTIEEPPDPPVPVVFHPPTVPAGAARAASASKGSVRPRPVARSVRLVAPVELPTRVGPAEPEAEVPGDADLSNEDPGYSEGPGGPGLVPGGTGDREGTLIDLSGTPPRPGGDVHAPELVRRVEPAYPEAARRARLEGLVVLEAIIAASGDIEEIRVIRSASALLDSAAEEAVRRWKYRPATLNGRAVRVLLTVTVSFQLH
jgi:protein TonB